MDNRNSLVANAMATITGGTVETMAAVRMLDQTPERCQRVTLSADKWYDCKEYVNDCRDLRANHHVARKEKGSAIDARTIHYKGYHVSLRIRKRVDEKFGGLKNKTVEGLGKRHRRGCSRADAALAFPTAAFNQIQLRNLTDQGYT